MMASIDGRIVADGWPLSEEGRRNYEIVHDSYDAEAWLCGRVTMEEHFAAGARSEADVTHTYEGPEREDHIAPGAQGSFAIAVDPRGKLVWDSSTVAGDHVVTLLTHQVSDAYLAALRDRGVSYILSGHREVDLPLALEKISERLSVRTIMLEGGGSINGSFLRDDLVDEVSLLLAPVIDGRVGSPSVFDVVQFIAPRRLELLGIEQRTDGVVHLRYQVSMTDGKRGMDGLASKTKGARNEQQ
jgi:2,5-diamino-6-(ribosylamino)-4(3H)-pyrimidinone 5'-phosphate reductase